MNASGEPIQREAKDLERTLKLIGAALEKGELSALEVAGLGTFLQNAYMGVERILRFLLRDRGLKMAKSEDWHKQLLRAAEDEGLVGPEEGPVLWELLGFRHRHMHGYAFTLEERRLRRLAERTPAACRQFLSRQATW